MIASLLEASPHSIRQNKRMIRLALDGQSAENDETTAMFARAFTLPDFDEGTRAFVEKRKPEF